MVDAQEGMSRAEVTIAAMVQQVRPDGRLAAEAAAGSIRGPFLAPVDLQLRQQRLAVADGGELSTRALAEAIVEAHKQLGTAVSCASDLRAYTAEVGGMDREWLVTQLQAECERKEGETDTTERASAMLQLRRRVGTFQVGSLARNCLHLILKSE